MSIRCGIFIGIHIVDRCPIPTFRFVQIKLPLTHLFGLISLLAHLVGLIAADREPLYQSATEGYVKCFQMLFSYYNLDESKLISDTKLQLQIYIFLSFSMSLCLFSTVPLYNTFQQYVPSTSFSFTPSYKSETVVVTNTFLHQLLRVRTPHDEEKQFFLENRL